MSSEQKISTTWVVAGVALAIAVVQAAGQTSINFALRSSAVNNGVGDMASLNFNLSSSVGDTTSTARQTGTGFVLSPGFWHTVIGVTQDCVIDIDGNQSISGTTDGVMLLRALFGLAGTAVTNGTVVGSRPWAEIRNYLNTQCGGNFAP